MNSAPILPRPISRLTQLRDIALLMAASVAIDACGLTSGSEEYVVQVDSVTVAAPAVPSGAIKTTYFGDLKGSCADLSKVERETLPADTLQLRFIGRRKSDNCIQAPSLLRYVDSLPNSPARTVHLVVRQPDGPPLRRDIVIPMVGGR